MERKILMLKEERAVWTCLLENQELIELHCDVPEESPQTEPALGNIYIGRVQNVAANIGAAFIDIGGVNCYYDISQAKTAVFSKKTGKQPLCAGDELIVQISREAAKTKAPTVSSNLNFTGRYAVLTTGNTRIGVSSKLPRSMREEYRERLQEFQNSEYGLIVRTNAKNVSFEEVLAEIRHLRSRYLHIRETAPYRTCFSCLEAAPQPYLTGLKNVYTEDLSEILVEDDELFAELESYFRTEQPELLEKLRLYDDPLLPLAQLYRIPTQRERALSQHVWLKHGGYLVIQPTEALTVIDVNSGKSTSKKQPSETYLQTNLEAAKEIAKQLRLRNLSGIIVIDFINMQTEEQTQTLLRTLKQETAKDPIQTTVVDVTGLQLVEVTRRKLRKPLHESVRQIAQGAEHHILTKKS